MIELERRSEHQAAPAPFGFGGTEPDPQDGMTADLLRAAQSAVTRALSTNSHAFMQNMRQDGGQ